MKIKQVIKSFALVTVLGLVTNISYAFEKSYGVALTSNYIFRGQTQSNNGSAIQASYDIEQEEERGGYLGVFASTVAKGLEFDLFAGRKGVFERASKVGYDFGFIKYIYTENSFSRDITEIYGGVNYETAYIKLFNADTFGTNESSYLDLGAAFVVLDDLNLDVHYGYALDGTDDSDISADFGAEVKGFDLNVGFAYENAGVSDDFTFFVTVGKALN